MCVLSVFDCDNEQLNSFWFTLTLAKKLMQALHEHVRIDIDIRILKPNFDGSKENATDSKNGHCFKGHFVMLLMKHMEISCSIPQVVFGRVYVWTFLYS